MPLLCLAIATVDSSASIPDYRPIAVCRCAIATMFTPDGRPIRLLEANPAVSSSSSGHTGARAGSLNCGAAVSVCRRQLGMSRSADRYPRRRTRELLGISHHPRLSRGVYLRCKPAAGTFQTDHRGENRWRLSLTPVSGAEENVTAAVTHLRIFSSPVGTSGTSAVRRPVALCTVFERGAQTAPASHSLNCVGTLQRSECAFVQSSSYGKPITGEGIMKHFEYFDIKYDSEITEIHLANPMYFDVRQFEELRDELTELVSSFRPRKLVVNFSDVRYCSTAIIASLLILKERIESYGGQMKFCGMNTAVRDSFAMLQLDGRVFAIHSTAAGAFADFSR